MKESGLLSEAEYTTERAAIISTLTNLAHEHFYSLMCKPSAHITLPRTSDYVRAYTIMYRRAGRIHVILCVEDNPTCDLLKSYNKFLGHS